MNNDSFLIEESDLELARDICKDIEDNQIRNRSMANALASDIASKYFKEIDADTTSGLHRVSDVLEDLDIADIYLNGSYIDVRVYFNDNELCVPKSHFDRGLLPVAYMFIKLESELSGGLVTGFVLPSSINTEFAQNGYYLVKEEDLVSYYDIEPLLVAKDTTEIPENFESVIFDFLDDKLSTNDKNAFYKILLDSLEYREFLRNASNAKNILSFVSVVKTDAKESVEDLLEEQIVDANEEDLNLEFTDDSLENFSEESFDLLPEESANDLETNLLDESTFLEASDDVLLEENDNVDFEIQEDVIELSLPDEDIESSIEVDNDDEVVISSLETESLIEDRTQEFEVLDEHNEENIILDDFVENLNFNADDLSEVSNDSFSTNITPSLDTIENDINSEDLEQALLNEEQEIIEDSVERIDSAEFLLEETDEILEKEIIEEQVVDTKDSVIEETFDNNEEQIEELFGEDLTQENIDDGFVLPQKRKSSNLLPIIALLTVLGGVGYFGYNKFINQEIASNEVVDSVPANVPVAKPLQENSQVQDAMPVETIENIKPIETMDEGNAISIPAIEQNLNTSVVVSNLSVLWEVPAGYVSNATAKRYFTKIGKIVQLNLKSELLLLNKTPITNKFGVELEFNKNTNKFIVKNLTISSGDKSVDDLVQNVVKNALDLNLKVNMNVFSTIVGNPTLIIRL